MQYRIMMFPTCKDLEAADVALKNVAIARSTTFTADLHCCDNENNTCACEGNALKRGFSFNTSNPRVVQEFVRKLGRKSGVELVVRSSYYGKCDFVKWLREVAAERKLKPSEISSEECALKLASCMPGGVPMHMRVSMVFGCAYSERFARSDYKSEVPLQRQRNGYTKKVAPCNAEVRVIYNKDTRKWVIDMIDNNHIGHDRYNTRVNFTEEMRESIYMQQRQLQMNTSSILAFLRKKGIIVSSTDITNALIAFEQKTMPNYTDAQKVMRTLSDDKETIAVASFYLVQPSTNKKVGATTMMYLPGADKWFEVDSTYIRHCKNVTPVSMSELKSAIVYLQKFKQTGQQECVGLPSPPDGCILNPRSILWINIHDAVRTVRNPHVLMLDCTGSTNNKNVPLCLVRGEDGNKKSTVWAQVCDLRPFFYIFSAAF